MSDDILTLLRWQHLYSQPPLKDKLYRAIVEIVALRAEVERLKEQLRQLTTGTETT